MRTKKSFLNFITSFFPWLVIAILGFLKIKLFINVFGSELNGLIQVVGQVYSYIAMLEMGFGAAVIFKLYKPFLENNQKLISEIFKGSKKIFRIMAFLMFLFGLIAAILAPLVIKSPISSIYIFAIFLLFAIDYLTIYFFALPYQSLLIANQKKYKLNVIVNSKNIIFKIIELFLIVLKINYIYILLISITFNLFSNLFIMHTVKREYPWLTDNCISNTSSISLTKDVFVHKLSKIIYDNTNIMVLSILSGGLVFVSIYTAYNYIVSYLKQIINFVFAAPLESFGNLFLDDKIKFSKKQKIYNEFFSLSLFLSGFVVIMFYISAIKFVVIWLNESYKLSTLTILMLSVVMWFEFSLKTVNIIIEATGKYKETKGIALLSLIANLLLSLLLGFSYNIIGVITAMLITQVFINHPLYINYTYKQVLKENVKNYYKKFGFISFILIILTFFNKFLILRLKLYSTFTYLNWFVSTCILGSINLIILIIIFYVVDKYFRNILIRFKILRCQHEN